MKMRRLLLHFYFLSMVAVLVLMSCCPDKREGEPLPSAAEAEEQARWRQLFADYHRAFPAATLKDMYKYGFQDYFGPAHIIRDSAACARYVESELHYLDSIGWRYVEPYEPLQLVGQHVRVNLVTVRDGYLSVGQLVNALMRSGTPPDSTALAAWCKMWPKVEQTIAPLADSLPHYAEDKVFLDSLVASGAYVSHHSAAFNADNHYGYRLIRKDIFEHELLPYLAAKQP